MLTAGALLIWHTQRRVRAERAAQRDLPAAALDHGERERGRRSLRHAAAADRLECALRRAARTEADAVACRHDVDRHPRRRREARCQRPDRRTRCVQGAGHHGGRREYRRGGEPRRWRSTAGARTTHAGRQLHRYVHGRDCAEALRNGLSRPGNAVVIDPGRRRRCDRDHQRKRQHRIVEPQRRASVRLHGRGNSAAERASAHARPAFFGA